MSEVSNIPEASAVASLVKQGLAPVLGHTFTGQAAPVILWPRDQKIESLERLLGKPVRKRATIVVTDYQSFVAYLGVHKESGTVIFAALTETGGKFVAVIDYHRGTETGEARFGDHVITLDMQHTPEWKRWAGADGVSMEQALFAQFLEDNIIDIQSPDGAGVLEVVKSLEASIGVTFKSSTRLENGDREILWAETTKPSTVVPARLVLKMPVFVNGPEYPLDVALRYKPTPSGVVFRIERVRPHKVIELALADARTAITTQSSLPVHSGTVTVLKPA